MSGSATDLTAELLRRCTFPTDHTSVDCAFSGGPDSTALVALARASGLRVTAHHVDHRIRPDSAAEADQAAAIADELNVAFRAHVVDVEPGPNLEARARTARFEVLPPATMTGHTADDQAETVLLRLLRGGGARGLSAMQPGPTHPILGLRRSETHALCAALNIEPVLDPSNDALDVRRNRVRHEALPLLDDIAARDLVPLLTRTADVLRDDAELLERLAAAIDPTDARAITDAEPALARRALRRWLATDGYPPDAATIDRVMAVARGDAVACEIAGGHRVERSRQRLRLVDPDVGSMANP